MSMLDDQNVDSDFQISIIKLVEDALKAAKDYHPAAQSTILQRLTDVLINEKQQTHALSMSHSAKYVSCCELLYNHGKMIKIGFS